MAKQTKIVKSILLILCFITLSLGVFSQTFSKTGVNITSGLINWYDFDYSCITTSPSTCGFTFESSKFYTKLEFTGDNHKHYTENWELKVTYSITLYDQNGNSYPSSTPQILKVDWEKESNYQDIDYIIHKSNATGIYYIGADINISQVDFIDKATNSPMSDPIASDMILSVIIESEKVYPLEGQPIVTYNQTTSYDATKNELTLNWDYVPHASGYELEVLPIDIGIADLSDPNSNFEYDFKDAIRISTTTNSYKLPMAFPRSLLIFRVRVVNERINSNGIFERVEGGFDCLDQGTLLASNGHEYMQYTGYYNPPSSDNRNTILDQKAFYWTNDPLVNPLADKTWQYSVTYAEEGKSKQAITFYDNVLSPTQSVAIANTDQTAIIQTTTQDFIGRPAVSIMPSPVASEGIRFYEDEALSTVGTSTDFNYTDFDLSNPTNNTFQNPLPIDAQNSIGSANYYSTFRSLTGINSEYIPEANGYTYARTKFTRDGTNRPISQTGVGVELGPTTDKTTDYYYASTNSQELERLFGNNVGIASNYKKNMVVDPNGQASVSYVDGSGRTIATGLSGGSTNGNSNIDTKPEESEFPDIVEDFSDNNKTSGQSKVISTKTILCQSEFNYEFTYNLPAEAYTNCLNGDCKYDLTIYITNTRTGERIDLTNQNSTTTSTTKKITEKLSSGVTITFKAHLKVGTYQITKEIELSQSDLQDYYDNYINQNNPLNPPQACYKYCPPTLETDCDFCIQNCEDKYIRIKKTIDPLTGEEIIKKSYNNDLGDEICYQVYEITQTTCGFGTVNYISPYTSTDKNAIDIIIQACSTSCESAEEPISACEAMYDRLKDDMSPLGQYFDNLPDLVNPTYDINDWLNDPTKNLNRDLNYFNNNNGVGYSYSSWDDVRTQWDPAWANIMLGAHPEFCAFESYCCVKPTNTIPLNYIVSDGTTQIGGTKCSPTTIVDGSPGSLMYNAKNYFVEKFPATNPATYYTLTEVADLTQPGAIDPSHPDYNKFHGPNGLIGGASWQMTFTEFIAYYNNIFTQKAKYELAISNCSSSVFPLPGISGNHHITSDGFEIRYPFIDWTTSSTTQTSLTACKSFCENSADVWIADFKCASAINDPSFPNDLDNIKQALISICKNSECNTLGYVQTPVTLTLKNNSSIPVVNFQDVFNEVRSAYTTYNMELGACPIPEINSNAITFEETCGCEMVLDKAMVHSGLELYELPANYSSLPLIGSHDLIYYLNIQSGNDPNSTNYSTAYNNCTQNIKYMDPVTPPLVLPNILNCPADNGISFIDQCESNLKAYNKVKTAFYINYYNDFIKSKAQDWINNYSSTCIDNVMDNESFTYQYKLREYHYTLYYYDQAGNLIGTVSPEGVYQKPEGFDETKDLHNASKNGAILAHRQTPSSSAFVHAEYAMQTNYKYNSLNQLTEQTTPDGGKSVFFYDYLGRLIASQNAFQATNNAYSYTVYDGLGRIREVGELINSNNLTDKISRTHTVTSSSPTTWSAWKALATSRKEIVKTYYNDVPAFYAYDPLENLRNRISCVSKFVNGTDADNNVNPVSSTYYSYDYLGNVKKMIQHNNELTISGNLNPYKTIDYRYDLISGNVTRVTYQKGYEDQFMHKYEYDADNRLTVSYTSKNGTIWEKESKNLYYPHGPLARSEIGDKQVQGLDYAYTLQGWLKTVNSSTSNNSYDIGLDGTSGANNYFGKDAFGYSLHYFSGDYQNTGGHNHVIADLGTGQFNSESPDLYNGNISKMIVGLTDHNENKVQVIGNTYKYDQLNRIKKYTPFLSQDENDDHIYNANSLDPSGIIHERYITSYTYDGNGNITFLNRNGSALEADDPTDPNTGYHHIPEQMDDFTYHYLETKSVIENSSPITVRKNNKLDYVHDPIGNPYLVDLDGQALGNYSYDVIGRLTSDLKEGISDIKWNVANKITEIIKSSGDIIKFEYDPMGNRISKTAITTGGFYTTTFYVRDAQANVMATYKKSNQYTPNHKYSNERFTLSDFHLYGSSRVGTKNEDLVLFDVGNNQILTNYDNSYRMLGTKRYELSNHLGNVLEVISDRKLTSETGIVDGVLSITSYNPDVISYSDYYPFGMLMPNRHGQDDEYRYGFNGEEMDDEIRGTKGASYDLGARMYDPRVARMLSVDPWTNKYAWQSPYVYHKNSPISTIDWKGLGDEPKKHKIESGETLTGISKQHKVSIEDLVKWNGIKDKDKIFAGKSLIVSDPNAKRNTTFFSAGAGHDEGNTGYVGETIEDMNSAGIDNPIDVEAHGKQELDAMFAIGGFSKNPYYSQTTYHPSGTGAFAYKENQRVMDFRIQKSANSIYNNIVNNNVDGQVNLIGYSTGSVIMAQSALYLATEKDIKIDNLVLIGTAISNDSQLMKDLLANKNIGNVYRVDIPGDNVSEGAGSVPSFMSQGNNHPHFKYAFHKNARTNRLKLFNEMVDKGFK